MPAVYLPPHKVLRYKTKDEARAAFEAMPRGCADLSGRDVVVRKAVNMSFSIAHSAPLKPASITRPAESVDDLIPTHERTAARRKNTMPSER